MKYLSLCSGIEAATVAWHPLDWQPVAFAEKEAFPSQVLACHYPQIPNLSDITAFKSWENYDFDILVGGTPCQSFSIAGLRKGLRDPRGNLMLTYAAVAARYKPRWLLWENVPGVLPSHGGRDFGTFLSALAELGYGFAYRVLDAQYVRVDGFGRAVPQRRRRVFVVGYLGDWRRAAAVLFDRESLSGNPAPRRQAGQEIAGAIGAGSERSGGRVGRREAAANHILAFGGNDTAGPIDVATARNAHGGPHGGPHGRLDFESETFVAHTQRADGFDAGEDGTGRGTPIIPIAFHGSQDPNVSGDVTNPLGRNGGLEACVAFDMRGREGGSQLEGPHDTANIRAASGGSSRSYSAQTWRVRRLTPAECERLQGFPDGYTNVPWRRKNGAPDGPRYKALGNSMAVNVMRWLGRRIALIDAYRPPS
jgi:DNA (cytosine-5)-methyltransferase 1